MYILPAPFILPTMNVNVDISHQVLNRLKGSSERLLQAINQPGIDRCFKGGPIVHPSHPNVEVPKTPDLSTTPESKSQSSREADEAQKPPIPAPVAEPITTSPIRYPEEQLEQEWQQMLQDVKQLQQERIDSQSVVDEIRLEMGKVAAYSRREVVRMGKRLDALEGAIGEVTAGLPRPPEPLNLSEDPHLQSLQQQLESLQETVSRPPPALSEDPHLQSQQRQVELLQQRVELLQEQISQPQEAGEGDAEGEQSTAMVALIEELQQRVTGMEQQIEEYSKADQAAPEMAGKEKRETDTAPDSKALTMADGRSKSIVEELRYEISEVRKGSNRQLEQLSSKIHKLSTSGEVNQIVKHATTQLQQRIDGIKKQIEQQGQQNPNRSGASPLIRF